MKKLQSAQAEQNCPACNGTGFPAIKQPVTPGRKIYPPPCPKCNGMGRIKLVAS
jgi:DnaJ-class molecular chaperone